MAIAESGMQGQGFIVERGGLRIALQRNDQTESTERGGDPQRVVVLTQNLQTFLQGPAGDVILTTTAGNRTKCAAEQGHAPDVAAGLMGGDGFLIVLPGAVEVALGDSDIAKEADQV